MLKKLSVCFIGLISCCLIFSPSLISPAQAQFSPTKQVGIQEIGSTAYEQNSNPKDVRLIIGEAIQFLLGLVGFILIVLMLISGIQYMTAMGNKTKIDTALSRIKNAFFGLIIILISYAATLFIIEQIKHALTVN